MPLEDKGSSPAVSDSALRLQGEPPPFPADVLERFPSLGTWADSNNRFWKANAGALQDFARAILDVTEIAGVLTVDPNNQSLYIRRVRGAGFWGDPDSAFYVDKTPGYFSLGASLTWNPIERELIVSGTIFADAGEIGGFVINADHIADTADSFGLSSVVTAGDDVRFWAGDTFANRATAPFRVYESGAIVATSGTIGGFSLGTDYIRDAANSMGLASTVSGGDDVRFWAGATFANRATAPFFVTEAGALTATNATITGTITATSGTIGGFSIGADYIRDAANSFGLASTVSGGNDVRFWAGATFANRATAPLRLYEDGTGAIGGFTINATSLTAGTGATSVSISSDVTAGIVLGDPTALRSRLLQSSIDFQNASGVQVVLLSAAAGDGVLSILTNAGGPSIDLDGGASSIVFVNDTNLYRSAANTLTTDDAFTALSLAGTGAGITALNASNISSGTIANARLPSAISVTSLTASGEIRGATARFGTFTGTADAPVNGWIDVTDAGGAARKLATVA